jgi:hypothetical protein
VSVIGLHLCILQVLQLHATVEQFTEVTNLLSQNDVGTGRQEVLLVDGHK